MKTVKCIIALFVFALISFLMYANEPQKKELVTTMVTPEATAALMVEKLGKDVQLSPEQKTVLLEKAVEFLKQQQQVKAQTQSLSKEQISLLKEINSNYQAVSDSVLTATQKTALVMKRKERIQKAAKIAADSIKVKVKARKAKD
jgi:hypothetical protein